MIILFSIYHHMISIICSNENYKIFYNNKYLFNVYCGKMKKVYKVSRALFSLEKKNKRTESYE